MIKTKDKKPWLYHPTKDYTTMIFFLSMGLIGVVVGLHQLVWRDAIGTFLDTAVVTTRGGSDMTIGFLVASILVVLTYWIIRKAKKQSFFHEDTYESLDAEDVIRSLIYSFIFFTSVTVIISII